MVVRQESSHSGRRSAARSDGVQSVNRAVRILTALAQNPHPMSVKEVAEGLDISSSAVHRMLGTLAALGWVEQNPRTSRYRIGTRLLGVGAASLITNPVVQNARVFLQRLSDQTELDSYLSTLVGRRVVYLARIQGRRGSQLDFAAGVSMPAHAFADGKLLLAYLPAHERQAVYRSGLRRYTERTIVDVEKLEAELARVRSDGFAVDHGERFSKGRAVAVPVMGPDAKPLMAMMCVVQADQFSSKMIGSLSDTMKGLSEELCEQLSVLGDMPRISVDFARYNFD